ncbi:PAS domain S-box/diguanylate cyclase (GGDEF) domain-containing protein [Idiomarina sp. A28L]|uniref:diguanylate cyclase domain-containing protein n=1 Tax=Idiomarina sp. A28L TaxID=1036674 RepID=UPI000213871C|nr:diguanylate cyclase [Idiomarina sp. A28L]EGN74806.1 PAS domain S-box/diguanylate cyclase (GGDEF) domain-containing protein [Idiomarina sp. A28L]
MPVNIKALAPKLINLMLDTVFVVDPENHIVFVSDACEELLGYPPAELIGTMITDYMHPEDLEISKASIERVMQGQPHIDFRNRYLRKDGEVVYILWAARWYEEEQVRIGVARDVTALKKAEDELRFLAHHDPLTGLTNRSLFNDRLSSAMSSARRHKSHFALLFLDVNNFKNINDEYGHSMGDLVLREVAQRLQQHLRETDTVARMGGDEFTVLLTDIQSVDAVTTVVQQIMTVMSEPLGTEFKGLDMPSCSIGVACYPDDGEDIDTLLSVADSNMYDIKRKGIEEERQ